MKKNNQKVKTKYPEHEKILKVTDKSQSIGDFMEWMQDENKIVLCKYHEHSENCYDDSQDLVCGLSEHHLYPERQPMQKILAQYFEIDLDKLEKEKQKMLSEFRQNLRIKSESRKDLKVE